MESDGDEKDIAGDDEDAAELTWWEGLQVLNRRLDLKKIWKRFEREKYGERFVRHLSKIGSY